MNSPIQNEQIRNEIKNSKGRDIEIKLNSGILLKGKLVDVITAVLPDHKPNYFYIALKVEINGILEIISYNNISSLNHIKILQ
jgi:hypothetical protein